MVQKNRLEWTVFAFSGAVLIAVFGFLAYHAVRSEGDAADIDIEVGAPQPQDGSFILPLTFRNHGGQSIQDVEVEVNLIEGGMAADTASITIPFLPRQSTREGWVVFTSDPAEADEIETRIIGYVVP